MKRMDQVSSRHQTKMIVKISMRWDQPSNDTAALINIPNKGAEHKMKNLTLYFIPYPHPPFFPKTRKCGEWNSGS